MKEVIFVTVATVLLIPWQGGRSDVRSIEVSPRCHELTDEGGFVDEFGYLDSSR